MDKKSGTVFSDKYPEDGSNFCVGNPSWGMSGGKKRDTASVPMKLELNDEGRWPYER